MAARRMANGDHPIEVERIGLRNLSQMIGGSRHVFKSARPAPALIADPAVFDAPGRDAGLGERRAQMAHIRKAVLRHPTPAMNHDGDGMRPRALGQSQVAELKFVRAVSQTMIYRRSWTSQNIAGRLPLPRADDCERRDRGKRERTKHDWSGNVSEHPLFRPVLNRTT